eukprot:jgi/Chrpa1/1016/Chrysochromulina_OHIO_Genome00012799-RA
MKFCSICGCAVPDNASIPHERGRKHNALRFYDAANATVSSIVVRDELGRVTRTYRPWEVPDRVVSLARRARSLVSPMLVAHSGVALFQRACDRFTPELCCSTLLRFDAEWLRPKQRGGGAERRELTLEYTDELGVLCIAALLSALPTSVGSTDDLAPLSPLSVFLSIEPVSTSHDLPTKEVVLSAALASLAQALPCCPPGSRVTISLFNDSLRQRRLLSLFIESLSRGLRAATGLAALTLRIGQLSEAQIGAFQRREVAIYGASLPRVEHLEPLRAEDAQRLHDAAAQSWSARAMTVLLGARASSASPLAKLTPDLVRLIIELVRRDCRTHVVLETAPVAGLALHAPTEGGAPLQAPPLTFAGTDLASVAQMLA